MQIGRRTSGTARATCTAICVFVAFLLSPASGMAQGPAPGNLLVATEEVRGPFFRETVVLLLHYDDRGASGLVVNRPMPAKPKDVLPKFTGIDGYEGALYWGGPVQVASLRALVRTNDPPADALHVFDEVYLLALDTEIPSRKSDASRLRFFLGYAGWTAGQLDAELLRESWHVLPATGDLVFTEDTAAIWRQLMPSQNIRAVAPKRRASATLITLATVEVNPYIE